MIPECTESLLAYLRTVPTLNAVTGLTLGAKQADPGLTKIATPYAWPLYLKDENTDPRNEGRVAGDPTILLTFVVQIGIGNTTESDMTGNQFPILDLARKAINAKPGPIGATLWRYEKTMPPVANPDRYIYTQFYTIIAS